MIAYKTLSTLMRKTFLLLIQAQDKSLEDRQDLVLVLSLPTLLNPDQKTAMKSYRQTTSTCMSSRHICKQVTMRMTILSTLWTIALVLLKYLSHHVGLWNPLLSLDLFSAWTFTIPSQVSFAFWLLSLNDIYQVNEMADFVWSKIRDGNDLALIAGDFNINARKFQNDPRTPSFEYEYLITTLNSIFQGTFVSREIPALGVQLLTLHRSQCYRFTISRVWHPSSDLWRREGTLVFTS